MLRRSFLIAAAFAALPWSVRAETPLPVTASFSILADMAREVGGDRVAVTALVPADADAHVHQPTPEDAAALVEARLALVNGLGFEGWLERLVEASGYAGPVVEAAAGIEPLAVEDAAHDHAEGEEHAHEHANEGHEHGHDHGAVDPHAWQSLAAARVYVANIAAALSAADPEGAAKYAANRDAYVARIAALEAEFGPAIDALPPARRTVVTSHDAFGYLARDFGLSFVAPQGISTEAEASAADVAALIRQIRAENIPAVFMENIADPRLLERITAETGAVIGGTLYSDALSGPDGPAATYLNMMRNNLATLTAALGS